MKESPVTGMPTVTEHSLQDDGSACVKLVGKVMDGPVLVSLLHLNPSKQRDAFLFTG